MKEGTFVILDLADFNELTTKMDTLINEFQEYKKRVDLGANDDTHGDLLSPKQLAKKLGRSEATVYAWRAKGIIKAHKIGRSTYFDYNEVLQVIKL